MIASITSAKITARVSTELLSIPANVKITILEGFVKLLWVIVNVDLFAITCTFVYLVYSLKRSFLPTEYASPL